MLTVKDGKFQRDGDDHLIVSGAIHYFRIHPGHWRDRLRRLKAIGANTVETYVPWNFHSPAPGVHQFDGPRDLGAFLDLAAELDLDIIVRPGPFICAEWEGGGLPGWLRRNPTVRLRCMDARYLEAVDAWFDVLIPILACRQPQHGGRVVMVQVENEYGSYGHDKAYLAYMHDGLVRRGIDEALLVTSDGPAAEWLDGGTTDAVMPTINFGSRTSEFLPSFRREFPQAAPMCMEFWNGWFDHWGEPHHVRDPQDAANELADMLDGGMSVNFYMAHGGTNFALWNGANFAGELQATVTSYDYNAPIAENGELTGKFYAFREIIGRHLTLPDIPADLASSPEPLPEQDLAPIDQQWLTCDDLEAISVAATQRFEWLACAQDAPFPPAFEDLGLERGMLLLRSRFSHPGGTQELRLHGLHDRAHVFINGTFVGILNRNDGPTPDALPITAERGELAIDLLVESLGRINYGPRVGERKGVLDGVWCGARFIMGWAAYPLPLDLLTPNDLAAGTGVHRQGLCLTRYELPPNGGEDTFLDCGQGRGFVYAGEQMVGRYWDIGPQETLYVPGPMLAGGSVTILATDGTSGTLRTRRQPMLGRQATDADESGV